MSMDVPKLLEKNSKKNNVHSLNLRIEQLPRTFNSAAVNGRFCFPCDLCARPSWPETGFSGSVVQTGQTIPLADFDLALPQSEPQTKIWLSGDLCGDSTMRSCNPGGERCLLPLRTGQAPVGTFGQRCFPLWRVVAVERDFHTLQAYTRPGKKVGKRMVEACELAELAVTNNGLALSSTWQGIQLEHGSSVVETAANRGSAVKVARHVLD